MQTLGAQRSTVLAVVLALVATLGLAVPASADPGAEADAVSRVNQERAGAGLSALQVAGDLTAVARRHSQRMADADHLHHNPNMGSDVTGWVKVGENVGRGPSVGPIHQGFMASPTHKANILEPDWTQVGVGVVVRDGRVWVTQLFRQPAGAPAAATEPSETSDGEATEATSDERPAEEPDPEPDPEPEPEPAGPRYDVTETPLGLDRGLVTLARLEAAERGATLSATLD